jgi:hypothetical protein
MLHRASLPAVLLGACMVSSLNFPSAVNRCSCAALELMTDWSTTLSKPEEIMKKLIAILMASLFAVGAAYAADAKKDDKKADAKKEEKKK